MTTLVGIDSVILFKIITQDSQFYIDLGGRVKSGNELKNFEVSK